MNSSPLWYEHAVFYELYVRGFFDGNGDGIGDLAGAARKLDYLQDLGIDCLWLLPIYPSPLRDDGYDIMDYRGILPAYGTLEDFKAFLDQAHRRGMRVITDLVLNHTSDQHPWFQAARSDRNSPFRDYYVWSDTDQKYKDARIIFLDTEKSNWTWDEQAGQFFWHRFYSHQPDLNYDNPAVRTEMLAIMRYWLDLGVDGFRADAVPYLFEREGTNCENLPETHAYLKEIRHFMDQNYPGRILLCEANQWPQDVLAYFGSGDEFHMAFQFPLMPRIFMALRKGDASPIQWALEQTPSIPAGCQWCTFLRNHDELTLEMVTEEDRQWMWQEYAPDPRMRLNLGIRRRLAPLLDNDRRKIELAFSLLFILPGSPIVYYGDEIGIGDDIQLPDRMGVRTPMQWDASPGAGFSSAGKFYAPLIATPPYSPLQVNAHDESADPGSLWHVLQKMISLHKQFLASGSGITWLDCHDPGIAAYERPCEGGRLLVFHNLSQKVLTISCQVNQEVAGELADLLTGRKIRISKRKLTLSLQPYQYLWLYNSPSK